MNNYKDVIISNCFGLTLITQETIKFQFIFNFLLALIYVQKWYTWSAPSFFMYKIYNATTGFSVFDSRLLQQIAFSSASTALLNAKSFHFVFAMV